MPALHCCHRRWLAGSDDFVLQGFRYALAHVILVLLGAIILSKNAQDDVTKSDCLVLNPNVHTNGGINEIHLGVSLLTSINAVIAIEFLILGVLSCRGKILESSKRLAVPFFIWLVALSDLLLVGAGGYTIHYVYIHNSAAVSVCETHQRNTLHAVVILSMMVSIYWVLCLIFLIDPAGGVPSHELSDSQRYEKLWIDRCRRAYCCFVSYDTYASEMEGVAVIMKNLFQAHDIVLSDIVAGFTLIRSYQRGVLEGRARKLGRDGTLTSSHTMSRQAVPLKPLTDSDRIVIRDIRHFAKYYVAVYGWWLHVFQHPLAGLPEVCCKMCSVCCAGERKAGKHESDWCGCNNAVLRIRAPQLRDEDILYMFYDNAFLYPAFLVTVDEPTKHIVISVRGTMSHVDCLTDGLAEPVPMEIADLRGQTSLVHRGFLESAKNIAAKIMAQEKCRDALNGEGPLGDYNIMFTGHSLGAGVATVLTLLMRERIDSVRRRARAIVYAPPGGLMSRSLSEYTSTFIVATFMGKDLIPRLTNHTIGALRDAMFYAIAATRKKKVEIIGRTLCPTPKLLPEGGGVDIFEYLTEEEQGNLRRLLETKTSEGVASTEEMTAGYSAVKIPTPVDGSSLRSRLPAAAEGSSALAESNNLESPLGSNSPYLDVRMYPPAKIMHFHRVGAEAHCCGLCCLPRGVNSPCAKLLYYPQWTTVDALQEIYCSPLMVADHFPDRFFQVIEDVGKAMEERRLDDYPPAPLKPYDSREHGDEFTGKAGLMYEFPVAVASKDKGYQTI